MRVVVDASFAGAWILPDEHSAEAEGLLKQVLEGNAEVAVPDLWSYEIVNLLIMAARRGRIPEEQIPTALRLLEKIPCVFYDHHSTLVRERAFRLATRFSLSAYDAAYLELADRLQSPLRSGDRRLAEAAGALGLGPPEKDRGVGRT